MDKIKKILITVFSLWFSTFNFAYASLCNTNAGNFVRASSQYATVTNNLGITTGAITVEGWFKTASNPPGVDNNAYYIANHSATSGYILGIAYSYTGVVYELTCHQGGNTADIRIHYTITLDTSTWYHVACTYDGTSIRLYENGSIVAGPTTADNGAGYSGYNNSTNVGAQDNAGIVARADGRIDDVRFWSGARSATDIGTDYSAPTELAGNETNLIAYYKLNNDWNDSQTNITAHNLTAVNSPTFVTDVAFVGTCASPAVDKPQDIFWFD